MKMSLCVLAGVLFALSAPALAGPASVTNVVTQGTGVVSVDSVDVRADGVYVDGRKVADLRPDGTPGDIKVVNGDVWIDGRKVKEGKGGSKDVQTSVNIGGVSAPAGTKVTKRVSVGSVTNVQAPGEPGATKAKGVAVDPKSGDFKAGKVESKGGTLTVGDKVKIDQKTGSVKAGGVTVDKDKVVVPQGGGDEGVVKMKKTVIQGVEVEIPE